MTLKVVETHERSSLSLSNLAISSSFKFIHASIPSPNLVSINVTRFLKGKLTRPTHKGFPHPRSIYIYIYIYIIFIGKPDNPVKFKITVSCFMTFPPSSLRKFKCSLYLVVVFSRNPCQFSFLHLLTCPRCYSTLPSWFL